MWISPFPPPACTSKKTPDTRKKCRSSQTGAAFFCLFVCSLIQLHLGSFLHLFFLLISFKSRPHGDNVPAAEPALNTGPSAPGPEPCSPSWPPDHSTYARFSDKMQEFSVWPRLCWILLSYGFSSVTMPHQAPSSAQTPARCSPHRQAHPLPPPAGSSPARSHTPCSLPPH